MGLDITIRIRRFPFQTLLGARSGLETQPCCKAHVDPQVEITENAVINTGLLRLSSQE